MNLHFNDIERARLLQLQEYTDTQSLPAFLFGSVVNGGGSGEPDIDVCILSPEGRAEDLTASLHGVLDEEGFQIGLLAKYDKPATRGAGSARTIHVVVGDRNDLASDHPAAVTLRQKHIVPFHFH
jgi:hypothetical protein